jgi:hypothetical protein
MKHLPSYIFKIYLLKLIFLSNQMILKKTHVLNWLNKIKVEKILCKVCCTYYVIWK